MAGSRPRATAALAAAVLLLILSAVPSDGAAEAPPGRVLATAVHPLDRAEATVVDEKIPLAELFTATWCPPCAPADRAVERLIHDESPGLEPRNRGNASANQTIGFALLAHHPFPDIGGEDPFGTPEGNARLAAKHDAFWFPSLYVDGFLEDRPASRTIVVDAGMEGILHQSYRDLLHAARQDPAPLTLRIEAAPIAEAPLAWDVNVTITAREDVPHALFLQAALWEDPVLFRGSNGIDEHRMVVRALTPRATLDDGLVAGTEWSHAWRVEATHAGLAPENAGLTVFVETAWPPEPPRDPIAALLGIALAVAAGTGVVAAIDVRAQRRRRAARASRPQPEPGPEP